MKKVKIGIVIHKYNGLNTKFTYGLEQNTYYLVSLLQSIPEYEVSYVITKSECLQESLCNRKEVEDTTPIVELKKLDPRKEVSIAYDVLIQIESYLPENLVRTIKEKYRTKFVTFLVGITMWETMENIIFNQYASVLKKYSATLIDEIWINPHHAYHITFVETLSQARVIPVPYLYEPWFLQKCETLRRKSNPNFNPHYSSIKGKYIGILEPNINLVKNAVIPICIAESLYRKNSTIFQNRSVRIYNSARLRKRKSFQELFDYFKNKSLFVSAARYAVIDIFNSGCNVVISHQHLCNLNYLYLDALYYRIPLVHNSQAIKNCGYYYPDFDINKGALALKDALENHDSNIVEYSEQADHTLREFSTNNPTNIDKYKSIINKLLSS